ncbi:hypothetical protein VKS41_008681 [Umbelopsis sp. WA50703]
MAFTDFCAETVSNVKIPESIDDELSSEHSKLHYIVCHHVLNVFQSTIWFLPSNFAKPYYIRRHKKYDIDSARPSIAKNTKPDERDDEYRDLWQRLLVIATSCGLNVDMLLQAIQMTDDAYAAKEIDPEARRLKDTGDVADDDDDTDDDEITVSTCNWSLEGIICLLATAISMHDTKELPISVDYSALFNYRLEVEQLKHLPNLLNRLNLREFANNCCFDKILIILFAALQPVEDKESNSLANMLKYDGRFDEYSLSKNFEGSEVSNQWFFTFQAIAATATMSSISSYRFLCYQLLTEILNRFTDESSAWMILELLENDPPMRPAAIGFVKQKIDDSLKKLQKNPDFHSIYLSHLIAKEFFPNIFTYDKEYYLNQEKEFWHTSSLTMQAINFYYYILIIDKNFSLLNVWSKANIGYVNENFITNVQQVIDHYNKLYETKQQELSAIKTDASKTSQESTFVLARPDVESDESMVLPTKLMNISLMQEALDKVLMVLAEVEQ